MKTLVILAAGTVLCLTACHRNDVGNDAMNDNSAMTNDMTANDMSANAAAPAALPTTAQAFIDVAASSDKFEIESSKLAATSAKSAAVKSFAKQMIAAHTATTAKLKSTLAGMSPAMTPNDALNADQQSMLDGLKGKTGADFDSAYASAQVTGHQKTLDALKSYASGGDNATLQGLAKNMIPTVTAHLNLAKGLK
jgi:Predicted outer membrane protein